MGQVTILVGDITLKCEWDDSPTARLIFEALPIDALGNYWGGEIYFEIPVEASLDDTAREVVEPGTVAYWPAGNCLCVFWGPTPASHADECRAAGEVNVVGHVLNPEALPLLTAREVRVEAAA
jgi:hypothetical protein